jgi:hypothetical protein
MACEKAPAITTTQQGLQQRLPIRARSSLKIWASRIDLSILSCLCSLTDLLCLLLGSALLIIYSGTKHLVCLDNESYSQQFLFLDVKTHLIILAREQMACVLQGLTPGMGLWGLPDAPRERTLT